MLHSRMVSIFNTMIKIGGREEKNLEAGETAQCKEFLLLLQRTQMWFPVRGIQCPPLHTYYAHTYMQARHSYIYNTHMNTHENKSSKYLGVFT